MFWDLIAAIAAGFVAAGVVLLLGRRFLPRWAAPVAAGVGMLGYTIWAEYSWYDRTAQTLPTGVVVTETATKTALWQPWTYALPMVHRFVALDRAATRRNDAQPGLRLTDLLLFERWSPVHAVPVVFDCPGQRRAALVEGAEFGAEGRIEGVTWVAVPEADPTLDAACKEEE